MSLMSLINGEEWAVLYVSCTSNAQCNMSVQEQHQFYILIILLGRKLEFT